MTTSYDLAFSLGFCCGVSRALRSAGLQHAAYPFDLAAVGSPGEAVDALCGEFRGFMEAEDLELVDVLHGDGFGTRVYRNKATGIGFARDFSDFRRFSATYPEVKARYKRSGERLLSALRAGGRALAVYAERVTLPRRPDGELAEARRRLCDKFPGVSFDVLYLCWEEGAGRRPAVVSSAGGVTTLRYDYRVFDGGRLTGGMDWAPLAGWLGDNACVPDRRTAEERLGDAEFEANGAARRGAGKGPVRRLVNRAAYMLYRRLERGLAADGLVHRERRVWFWDDDGFNGAAAR